MLPIKAQKSLASFHGGYHIALAGIQDASGGLKRVDFYSEIPTRRKSRQGLSVELQIVHPLARMGDS